MKCLAAFSIVLFGCGGPEFTVADPSTDRLTVEGDSGTTSDSGPASSAVPQDAVAPLADAGAVLPEAAASPPDAAGAPPEVDASDVAVPPPPPKDSGPICSSVGQRFECAGPVYFSDATYYDTHTTTSIGGDQGCSIYTTPPECRCAETYTCACILAHSTSGQLCRFAGTTANGCVMQGNGVPLVNCQ